MSRDVNPEVMLTLVNSLFNRFDVLCDVHKVQKVDTAGDRCGAVPTCLCREQPVPSRDKRASGPGFSAWQRPGCMA